MSGSGRAHPERRLVSSHIESDVADLEQVDVSRSWPLRTGAAASQRTRDELAVGTAS
jgi:hypothetical protein